MSEASSGATGVAVEDARDSGAWGWSRAFVVAGCLVLGLALGLGYFLQADRTYQATATVLVLPTSSGLDLAAPVAAASADINMDTEAELARSASVADSASAALNNRLTADELISSAQVTVPTNSQVLEFTVQAGTAQLASDAANALAGAYLARRSDAATRDIDRAVALLTAQRDAAETRQATLTTSPPPGQPSKLTAAQLDQLSTKISDINKQLVALRVGTTEGGQVITEAQPPAHPVSPKLMLSMVAGLIVGGALAAAVVLLGALRRERTELPHAEPTQRSVRVLASVAQLPDVAGSGPDGSELQQACRVISTLEAGPGPIAVFGGREPVTGTRVALALARAWAAEFGKSVVVATGASAGDILPEAARGRPGLVDLLLDEARAGQCGARLPKSTAMVVGPGKRSEIAATVGRRELMQAWERLQAEFGTVLVSTTEQDGPWGAMTVQTAGRVVAVVQAGTDRDQDLRAILDDLDSLAATERLVGVIVVEDQGSDDSLPETELVVELHHVTKSNDVSGSDRPLATGLGGRA
ncbi:MAG: hypothetical protein WAN48_02820 [Actinomycetes bacterium]